MTERQRIERVPGSRRARLTAAPGSIGEDRVTVESDDAVSGANDDRMRQDVPPHY